MGKSTLLNHLFPSYSSVVFDPVIDIENAKRDPDLFLANRRPPVILDEIQYVPELVPAIKRRIDKDRSSGQYLITGSQQWQVMKNISESLAIIDFYEKNIESLSEQFTTIDKQLRLGTQTREVVRGEVGYRTRRSRERFPSNYDYYYYNQSTGDIARTGRNRRRDDNRYPTAEKITTEEPLVSIQLIYTQLTGSLRDLVSEYRKTLNLTKRWPGGLPPELNRSTLQKNMDSASAELDNLYRYRPVYPNQAQPQSQQRSGRYRRR